MSVQPNRQTAILRERTATSEQTHPRGRRRRTSWSGRGRLCICPGRRHRTSRGRSGRRTAHTSQDESAGGGQQLVVLLPDAPQGSLAWLGKYSSMALIPMLEGRAAMIANLRVV
jgi:hypothetical protein